MHEPAEKPNFVESQFKLNNDQLPDGSGSDRDRQITEQGRANSNLVNVDQARQEEDFVDGEPISIDVKIG